MTLPTKAEEELIDRAARLILEYDVNEFVMPLLEMYSRTIIIGTLAFQIFAPWSMIMGQDVFNFVSMMGTNPKEFSNRLINRIKELEEEKLRLKDSQKNFEQEKQESRFRSFLKRFLKRP